MWQIEASARTADPAIVERISSEIDAWRQLGNISVSYSKKELETGKLEAGMSTRMVLPLGRSENAPPPTPTELPAWVRPTHVLGACAPANFVLVRTDEVAVAVWGFTVFATGFEYTVAQFSRGRPLPFDERRLANRLREPDDLSDDVLRLWVACADGTRASATDEIYYRYRSGDDEDVRRLLLRSSGGGSGRRRFQTCWCWPLPPAGEIVFSCEWPAFGIPVTEHRVRAEPILQAAADSEPIWPDR